jgi:hypothetical protein
MSGHLLPSCRRADGERGLKRSLGCAVGSKEILGESVDKQKKTATDLEEILKQRIGAGDFKVTVHRDPELGWHAKIYGREPTEVHRCQVMADTIAAELSQHYELVE